MEEKKEGRSSMMRFTGSKTVFAKPMTLGEFKSLTGRDPYNGMDKLLEDESFGYIVQYEDGYVSWSPKSVFEKSYHSSETYLDRLIEEFQYDKEKLQNLQNFIRSETYSTLPVKKKHLLRNQHSIMIDFCDILYGRITVEQCQRFVDEKLIQDEGYEGFWYLREGDFLPEQLKECFGGRITRDRIRLLEEAGNLFPTREKAADASRNIRKILRKDIP